jgi:TolB protein
VLGPRWSPDGRQVVYTSYRTSFPDIYVIDFVSRRVSLLASFKGTNSGGRFSPDGSRLAMVLSGEGNPEVYVGNAQGRSLKRMTTNQSVEASPTFSPDGSRLLFVSDAAGGPQLYTMPSTGGQMSRLPTNISKYCAEPDWSAAEPSKIVFTAGVGRGYQVAVYDQKAGTSKIVSKAPTDAIEPVWLADGRHVICTFRAANTRSIYIVDTESGKATRISPTAFGNAGSPSYLAQ